MKRKHPVNPRSGAERSRRMEFIDLDEEDFDEDYEDEYDDEYGDDDYDDDYEDDSDDEYDDEEYEDEDLVDEYEEDGYDEDEYDDEPDDEYEDDRYEDDRDDYEDEYDDYESNEFDEYDDPEDEYDDYGDYDEYEEGYYDDNSGIKGFFAGKSALDLVMIGSGIVAAILLIVVGIFFLRKNPGTTQSEMFADFGAGMEGIDIIGHDGLVAMADANMARIAVAREAEAQALAQIFEEETEENAQAAEEKTVVIMNLVSVQKDLKIKFVNNSTKRLITGVQFNVSVTDPSGTTNTQTDTDSDGIIYLKNITPGAYKVSLQGPESDDYSFSKDSVSIKVKDSIEYKKVDVVDEIKSEKEINAAAEDTEQGIEVESTLKDTVEWVESSKTAINETVSYSEVSKDDISDPGKTAALNLRLVSKRYTKRPEPNEGENPDNQNNEGNQENNDPSPTPEQQGNDDPTPTPEERPTPTEEPEASPTPNPTDEPTATPAPTPTAAPTATVQPSATPSATAAPTVTPSVTPSVSPSASVSPSPSVSPTPSSSPTPSAADKAKTDTTSTLKTKKGEVLYIKDGDKYIEAKYADFYKNLKFYKKVTKGEYKYTGWQTIDGYTYFYDKNGKFVTGEQVIQGAKYVFSSDGHLDSSSGAMGIDVSKWNGQINWENVKKAGVSYVIIRCGYRGSSSGALIADPMFKANINGAKDAGLKVGIYFYSQAVDEIEAVEEASMTLSLISGYSLAYPVFIDVEGSKGRGDSISAEQRTAVCKAFCQTIQNSGYKAGVYSNKTWLTSYLDISSLSGYKIWLAQYASAPTYNKSRYDMWQYSSKGSIPGISGNVDLNISYLGY